MILVLASVFACFAVIAIWLSVCRSGASMRAWIVIAIVLPLLYRDRLVDEPTLRAAIVADRKRTTPRPPEKLMRRFAYRDEKRPHGRQLRLAPLSGSASVHILYFHGGAYVMQIVPPHWSVIGGLLDRLAADICVPLYPLAPEATVEQGIASALAAYDELLGQVGADNIVIAGDSAGGGMTLALAQQIHASGRPKAAALVLFCPWLDATVSGADQPCLEQRDPTLHIEMLRAAGRMWAGDGDPGSPLASPLFGNLENLPPTLVFGGGRDLLSSDARRMCQSSPTAELRFYKAMFHVWMAAPIPEGAKALDEAADFIRRHAPKLNGIAGD